MHEQERQREINLILLIVYTLFTIILMGESIILGWEIGAVVLLMLGAVACWWIYMTDIIPYSIRIWLYQILSMLAFFFYGIHETSMYDLAPVMILAIILYSATEQYRMIQICVITYILTMCYDFIFVIKGDVELSALMVTRTLLHFALVCISGYLMKTLLKKRSKERKLAEEKISELEEMNRRTEDFLTNVSHELRTPINAVTGITAVMLKKEENEERRKDIISIRNAGHRLFRQIGDILDYTEIDTGRIKVSSDVYMITSLVNDIIIGNHALNRENMPELIFDIDPAIPSGLIGDEKKIKRILEHLIDNAFKFTKEGGILVRIYALRKTYGINLCIRVSDTGMGIAEDELEIVGERFYQSDAGRNRRVGGLGLGLPIVYGMVSAMDGFLRIESTVGKGTTVSVSIPQKVSDEAPGIVVENREDLCMACYIRPEKFEVPEVRDYYNEMILHMVQGLDIALHRVYDMGELARLTSMYHLTHLLVGSVEYEEHRAYFEELAQNIRIIIVAGDDFVLQKGSRAQILRKPFYSLSVANLLNVKEEMLFEERCMICPGVKVLVVDDEPMNLMVAEGIFRGYQMSVTTAESGRKAIELVQKEDFDLIFLDHMMPEMDGVETLKRLRKIKAGTEKEITIIAFTANAVSGAREMFLREGFDEFVSKPIETLELERILKKVLPKSAISYVDESEKYSSNIQNTLGVSDENNSDEVELSKLNSVGINTQSGIQYCLGDSRFYVELLTKFVKESTRKETDISRFYEQGDFDNYAIIVHALKSNAKMLGADELSENAKMMEAAAKKCDESFMNDYHEKLLEQYRQIVQSICEVLHLDRSDVLQVVRADMVGLTKEELLQSLVKLKEGLDTFEADKADTLIADMSKAVYQEVSVGELLHEIAQDVDDYEFASASLKVDNIINKLEGGEL